MVRCNSIEASTRSSMAEFDDSELFRSSEFQANSDQADLKFLSGENYRLVPTTSKLLEKFDSMEAKMDVNFTEIQKTLSQLCAQLGIHPIEADSSHQPSPVTYSSDPSIRDDFNRLPLDNRKSLLRKIDLPKFDASNAYDWLSKVDKFFRIGRYSDSDKLDLVALSLEGDVLKWFNWKMICQKFPSWDAFRRRLLWKFGAAPEKSSENVTESLEEKASYTAKKLILQYQEIGSTNGNGADVESDNGAKGADGGGDVAALPPPPPILPPNEEPLHVKTEPVEKTNLRVPVVSKILDQLHEPYHSDLEGKTFAYGGEKTVFTRGVLPDNKLGFAVVLEEVSAARPNGNASPNGNENELIHDNLKSHMWHKWKSKHLRPVFDLQTSPSYALDVVNKTSTPWETQNPFTSTQVDSVHFLSFEVGTADQLFSGLSQTSQVWEPGGVLARHVLVDWLVDCIGYVGTVADIRCLVLGVCSGIKQPIVSRRASRVWERGGVDMSTALTAENNIMRLGWMVFDRGKNNIISGDVITPLMNAWYSCQQEETTSAESSSAVQRDEEVSVVLQQGIIADSVEDTREETVVVEESAISEPEAAAVVDVRCDDVGRRKLLINWQAHDASESSWLFSMAFVQSYHAFKLEDKLVFGEGSIDTIKQSYCRRKREESVSSKAREASGGNRGFAEKN